GSHSSARPGAGGPGARRAVEAPASLSYLGAARCGDRSHRRRAQASFSRSRRRAAAHAAAGQTPARRALPTHTGTWPMNFRWIAAGTMAAAYAASWPALAQQKLLAEKSELRFVAKQEN